MLPIEKLQTLVVYDKDWHKAKLGKISASNFYKLVSEKSDKGVFLTMAKTYIRDLAGEHVTGKSTNESFTNFDTEHGILNEPYAIAWALQELGYNQLSTNGKKNHFVVNDIYSGCTPDSLITKHSDIDKAFRKDDQGDIIEIDVDTLEVKCPTKNHRFIELFECETPEQLKKASKQYYYQVIFQMICCNSLNGYFAAYNESYPIKGRVIHFRKLHLKTEFEFAKNTLKYAIVELEKTISFLTKKIN